MTQPKDIKIVFIQGIIILDIWGGTPPATKEPQGLGKVNSFFAIWLKFSINRSKRVK